MAENLENIRKAFSDQKFNRTDDEAVKQKLSQFEKDGGPYIQQLSQQARASLESGDRSQASIYLGQIERAAGGPFSQAAQKNEQERVENRQLEESAGAKK